MRAIIYNLISKLVKIIFGGNIIGKRINGLTKILYYERSQHLIFLFKSVIRYEENIQRKVKKYLKEGDVVFDIGANIGQYALPFSEFVGSSGKVYSFEPDYKNFSFLQFNTNINKCANVTCLNHGIGGENTQREFFRDTETGGRKGSFIKEYVGENYKGLKEKVVLRSFDTIISMFGKPNFVKIDVEGYEADVVLGLTTELQNCIFLVEVRDDTKLEIYEYFKKKGFECILVDSDDELINRPEDIPGFANLIFKMPVIRSIGG